MTNLMWTLGAGLLGLWILEAVVFVVSYRFGPRREDVG